MTELNSAPAFQAPVRKDVPPKMTDAEFRLECAKLAVQAGVSPAMIVDTAQAIHTFVKAGKP